MDPIYLDNHATTRPTPEVVAAVSDALVNHWHNPSSVHRPGQNARYRVELARAQVGRLLGVKAREITFTGSGTEAIDLAIRGVLGAAARSDPARNIVITNPIEHSAVRNLCKQLSDTGRGRTLMLPVLPGGVIDAHALGPMLDEHEGQVALVSVQWANNETGVIQPVSEIGTICAQREVVFHCDATQWVGKMPMDLSNEDAPAIDLLNCSAHKFHGPKGVGALWVRRGIALLPTTPGAQELGRRGGTEPVPAILGMGVAAEQALAWLGDEHNRLGVAALRDRLEAGILAACPGAVVNGDHGQGQRLWSASNIGFPGLGAEALLLGLSERGVCVSAGAACASGSLDPSPVLLAMGVEDRVAHGSIRLSLGRETGQGEIDRAVEEIARVWASLSRAMPGIG